MPELVVKYGSLEPVEYLNGHELVFPVVVEVGRSYYVKKVKSDLIN